MGYIDDIEDSIGPVKLAMEVMAEQTAKVGESLLQAIGAVLRKVLDESPAIDYIEWTQYIPYFNDGDVCEFRVYKPVVMLMDGDELCGTREWNRGDAPLTKPSRELLDAVCDLIQSRMAQPYMESAFGKHARVTVTRDGISAEAYVDHD